MFDDQERTFDQEPPPCGVRRHATSRLAQGILFILTVNEINGRSCTFTGQEKRLAVLRHLSSSGQSHYLQNVVDSKIYSSFQGPLPPRNLTP